MGLQASTVAPMFHGESLLTGIDIRHLRLYHLNDGIRAAAFP